MSENRRNRIAPLDRVRYFLLAPDPGLLQLKHGAKTVLAVVLALEAFRRFDARVALYAGMSAGFLMQSTAGVLRRTRMISMLLMGGASTLSVGLGSALSGHWAKESLVVAAAFGVFYVRRYIPGKAMFPVFGFVLTLLATVQPGGARAAVPMMGAIACGLTSAFAVFFFVLPDESSRAFRHAADLFLFRLRHARRNPMRSRDDLKVMHRAVALEEEERPHLEPEASAHLTAMLEMQYEALQVLTLLNDIERQPPEDVARLAAAGFSRSYLAQVTRELRRQQELWNG